MNVICGNGPVRLFNDILFVLLGWSSVFNYFFTKVLHEMSRARKVVLNKGVCRVTIYPVQGVPCPGQIECMRIRFVSCCTSMSWLALPLGSQDHSHHMSHGCDAMRWGGTMVWTWAGIASR